MRAIKLLTSQSHSPYFKVQIHREFDESEYQILEKIGDGTEAAVYKSLSYLYLRLFDYLII
jgi:hypothetical protein